jgi:hypothetical protein
MFKTHKEKGNDFFSTTRVESCSHVKLVGGKAYAIPFIPKKKLTAADKMVKSS